MIKDGSASSRGCPKSHTETLLTVDPSVLIPTSKILPSVADETSGNGPAICLAATNVTDETPVISHSTVLISDCHKLLEGQETSSGQVAVRSRDVELESPRMTSTESLDLKSTIKNELVNDVGQKPVCSYGDTVGMDEHQVGDRPVNIDETKANSLSCKELRIFFKSENGDPPFICRCGNFKTTTKSLFVVHKNLRGLRSSACV